MTPEEKNGATRLSDQRFNTNDVSGQNYNDYINSEVGKKQAQQNTQLTYTPSWGAQIKQNIDKSMMGSAEQATAITDKLPAHGPLHAPLVAAADYVYGAGKYIGNKVIQAGEKIFKGGS